mgnify:CR=1 FL=1
MIDDENTRITVNLRLLRLMLDRTMDLTETLEGLQRSVMDLIKDIAPEVGGLMEKAADEEDRITDIINDVDIPDNVIPFIKKESD